MFKQYFQLRISEVNISTYFLNHIQSCLIWYQILQHGGETKMRLAMAIGKCKSGHIMIRARCAHQPDHNRCTITQFHEKSLIQDFCKMQDKSKVLVYNLFSYVKWIVPHEHRLKLDFHVSDPYCLFHPPTRIPNSSVRPPVTQMCHVFQAVESSWPMRITLTLGAVKF